MSNARAPKTDGDQDDVPPSASARFRLKIDPFGRLIPEVVPVDEDGADDDEDARETG